MIARTCLAGLLALMITTPAWAHGLLMKLSAQDARIVGELYYSNGRKAPGEWIEIVDLAAPSAAPVTLQTGPDGGFSAPGLAGHAYKVTASGEEGHTVAMELTLEPAARPRLADDAAPAERASDGPPAWLLVGGLLLLSVIPALWLRRRAGKDGA